MKEPHPFDFGLPFPSQGIGIDRRLHGDRIDDAPARGAERVRIERDSAGVTLRPVMAAS